MSKKITKRHNSYRQIDGVVLGWERGKVGEGHSVRIIDHSNDITTIKWKSPKDPTAGDQVTVVMPEDGVSAKKDRPIMILNHTNGDNHREINAHDPLGVRRIMVNLVIWETIAAIIAAVLILSAEYPLNYIFALTAAAIIVWRLAIATSKVRASERAAQRKIDEEEVCTKVSMAAWENNTSGRLPRKIIAYDSNGQALKVEE